MEEEDYYEASTLNVSVSLGFAFFFLTVWTLLNIYLLFGNPPLDEIGTITAVSFFMVFLIFLFILLAILELELFHRESDRGEE